MISFNSSFSERNSKYFKNIKVKIKVGVMINSELIGIPNLNNSKLRIVGIDIIKQAITKLLRIIRFFIYFVKYSFLYET